MLKVQLIAQEIELARKLEAVREDMRENYDMEEHDPYWQELVEREEDLLIELGQVRVALYGGANE